MNLELKMFRYGQDDKSTGGALSCPGFFGHTCEDEHRDVKVAGETRIPAGRYEIKLRDVGPMNEGYHAEYGFHRGMLHLQNVPGFEWIYIHPLTNEKQTDGCIGVGYSAHSKGGFEIARSKEAYIDLYKLILLSFGRNGRVFITISEP